jgi:uncharacterized membrane protein
MAARPPLWAVHGGSDPNMRISGFGHALLGTAVAGIALLCLVYGNFAPMADPLPASLPWATVCGFALGALLLAAGAGLFFARTALACVWIVGVGELAWAVDRARPVFSKPLIVGSWYGVAEALGSLMGAWTLYVVLRRQQGSATGNALEGDRALRAARGIFGAACVVYGAAHFAYATYTAAMVPAWLPARMGFAYVTGACHAAAGIGLLFGILPRLAATLEATMVGLFGVMVWLPSFFSNPVPLWAPSPQIQWSETLVTFLLAASAWIIAATLRAAPRSFSSPE